MPTSYHAGQKGARQLRQRNNVDLQHIEEICLVVVNELPLHREAGIVDQHVDDDVLLLQFVEQLIRGRRNREICGKHVDPDGMVVAESFRECEQRGAVTGNEYKIVPLFARRAAIQVQCRLMRR